MFACRTSAIDMAVVAFGSLNRCLLDKKVNAEGREGALGYFSRELYVGIYLDKMQYSSAAFLQQLLEECPYIVEYHYSGHGKEY